MNEITSINVGGVSYSLGGAGGSTTIDNALSSTSENPVQNKIINSALSNKVDKITGKGLSTNDYTNADKDAISQFSGLVIDYGTTAATPSSDWRRKIYFNKTFSSIPTVVCTYKGTGTFGNDSSWGIARISDVSSTAFYVELFDYNGNHYKGSITKNYCWIAIGT